MKAVLSAFLVLLLTCTAAQAANQRQGHIFRLKRISVEDQQGWGQKVVAYTILVPADWKVEGGIQWNPKWQCLYSEMVTNRLRVTSPDGRYAFELFPDYGANWNQDPVNVQAQRQMIAQGQKACPLAQPFNARDFITRIFLPGFRPGAQVVNVQQDPAPARALYQDTVNKIGNLMRQNNVRMSTDAAKVLVRYRGGEEMVLATTAMSTMQGPSPSAGARGQVGYATAYTLNASRVVAYRTPPGEMQSMERIFGTMLSSIHLNPAWQKALNDLIQRISNITLKGVIDRHNIWRNAMNEIGEIRMKSWQNVEASQDHIAKMWSQAIRDVADYYDPETQTKVELPWGYDNVWSSGLDEYLLTDIPGFNPNSDIQTSRTWTEMKAIRH